MSPESLVKDLNVLHDGTGTDVEVPSTIANFGNPPYGSKLVGKAFFHPEDNFACLPLDHITVPKEEGIPILMADRGNCTFAIKAKRAQNAGYKALVVIDNIEEPVQDVIMSENGSGGNIFIPVMMIPIADGYKIKGVLASADSHVELRLTFDIEQRSRVNLRVIYSSDNSKAYSFFNEFVTYASYFNHTTLSFHPHFALWYSVDAMAENFEKAKPDCLSGGRYCAPDPDGKGAMTGRDVVMEDLRQICLLQRLAKNSSSYFLWFTYTAKFGTLCREKNITQACSNRILKDIGFNASEIDACIAMSVVGEGDIAVRNNSLLQNEVKMWRNLGIEFYPSIMINNRTYRGDWEGEQIAQTICSGYFEPPSFCASFYPENKPTPIVVATGTVMMLVAASLVLIVAVLVLYRAWVKRELNLEMRQQVNLAVSQYYALNSEGSQMAERKETLDEFRSMKWRRFFHQAVNLCLIVSTALMTWKGLMLVTMSESPVVVVLSGSMEPAYYRGDILALELREDYPLEVGDVVVYKLSSKEIPIVHRIVNVHEVSGEKFYLTKGDNNNVNDRALYDRGQNWVQHKDLMGRARVYLPYAGMITIWLSDYPILKYVLIGSMVVVILTSREPQS